MTVHEVFERSTKTKCNVIVKYYDEQRKEEKNEHDAPPVRKRDERICFPGTSRLAVRIFDDIRLVISR